MEYMKYVIVDFFFVQKEGAECLSFFCLFEHVK